MKGGGLTEGNGCEVGRGQKFYEMGTARWYFGLLDGMGEYGSVVT